MRRCPIFAFLLFVAVAGEAGAQQAEPVDSPDGPIRVGTKEAVPFAMREGSEWKGMSIDLWDELAEELGLTYELVETDLEGLIGGLEDGSLDLSIAALTMTAERESRADFSHPYYSSGLGIAAKAGIGSWLGMVERIASAPFLRTLGLLFLTLLLVGVIVWYLERRHNEQFGGRAAEGIWSGFWWSAVTMTTVGYGDKAPATVAGRVVALVWMFAGLVAISSLTAAMASALTLSELSTGVSGPGDLGDVTVGSVEGSTSAGYLERRGIDYRSYPDVRAALVGLEEDEIEAVVYDRPILAYLIRGEQGKLRVLDSVFDHQDYAIAFPEGSELRETVNRALLDLKRDGEWRSIRTRYLGEREANQ